MYKPKLPLINIVQSISCINPLREFDLNLNIRIIPDKDSVNIKTPFFGIWIIDLSGSMRENIFPVKNNVEGNFNSEKIGNTERKIDAVKSTMIDQINNLPDGTMFSLITFGNPSQVLFSNININVNTKKELISKISLLQPKGNTPMHEGIQKALDLLNKYQGHHQIKKAFLISDGRRNYVQGLTDKKFVEKAKEFIDFNATMDVVHFPSNDKDKDKTEKQKVKLMYNLATNSGGKYFFVNSSDELKKKFFQSVQQTAKIIYLNPNLSINPIIGILNVGDNVIGHCGIQSKPLIAKILFEKLGINWKAWLKNIEGGIEYVFAIKIRYRLDDALIQSEKIKLDVSLHLMDLIFDFGNLGTIAKPLFLEFSENQIKFKRNLALEREYNLLITQLHSINDSTQRGDPITTRRKLQSL
jgi:Ca-activated chloride channel homolog